MTDITVTQTTIDTITKELDSIDACNDELIRRHGSLKDEVQQAQENASEAYQKADQADNNCIEAKDQLDTLELFMLKVTKQAQGLRKALAALGTPQGTDIQAQVKVYKKRVTDLINAGWNDGNIATELECTEFLVIFIRNELTKAA